MNVKTTIVLLIVAIALLVAILFTGDEETGPAVDPDLFPDFNADEVTELTWGLGADETTVRRVKGSEDDWVIVIAGLEVPASSTQIDDLLVDLGSARIRSRIPDADVDASSRTEYGLDPVSAWVRVKLGDVEKKVMLGVPGLQRDTSYAQLDGEEDVLLVSDDILESIQEARPEAVRAKRVFDGSVYDIRAVVVAGPEGTKIAAARSETDSTIWVASEPFTGHVDPRAMETDLLPAILNLEAEDFIEDGVAEDGFGKYGLDEPRYRVSLTMKDGNEARTLLVGSDLTEKEGYVHFMEEGRPFVYGGKGVELLEILGRESVSYRDRNVTRLGWAALGRIEGRLGDTAFVMVRDGDAWRLEEPEKMSVEQGAVDSWLQGVREQEVQEFLDAPDLGALGLKEPRGSLAFWPPVEQAGHDHGDIPDDPNKEPEEKVDYGEPIVVILVGADAEGGKGVYAMRKGEEEVAYLCPSSLVDLVRNGHHVFRGPEVFGVQRAKLDVVKVLRSTEGADPEVLEKTDDAWPEKTNGAVVTRIVSTLFDLRAVRWVGPVETRAEECGLAEGAEPSFRIVLTTSAGEFDAEPKEYGLLVGGKAERGRYARAVREGKPGEAVFVIAEGDLERLRMSWVAVEKPAEVEKPGEPEKPAKDQEKPVKEPGDE